MSDYALDTAARFGDIPFVEFTKGLIHGVFDALVEANAEQMEQYAKLVASLSEDLSTYINNTNDGVSFDQIAEFVQAYDLPQITEGELTMALQNLQKPPTPTGKPVDSGNAATTDTWWGGLINALAPAAQGLLQKIGKPQAHPGLEAVAASAPNSIPTYAQIHQSIASLIASNKYSILQNLVRQGMMRIVVTEGELETRLTFSTWNTSESGQENTEKERLRVRTREKNQVGIASVFRRVRANATRQVTVNTAKSYQRDTSGTRVDIFSRVLIRFKSDYAPLNG
jgi:hypothetical protein